MKFCKDCKHHFIHDMAHLCLRKGQSEPDMVTGESYPIESLCKDERESVMLCGKDAKYFKQKDTTDAK